MADDLVARTLARVTLEFYRLGVCLFRAECSIAPDRGATVVFTLPSDFDAHVAGSRISATVDSHQPPYDLDFVSPREVIVRIAIADLRALPA